MFSSLQKPKTCWTKYLQYHNFQHPYSLCTRYRSSRLLRSRPHRCSPSDFGSVRLVAFLRAAYSVPHPHSLRPGPPVIQAPLRALCSEIPKTHGRSSERQRCSLRSRAVREFTRLPGPNSQAYIQTQHHLRTSRHLSRAISPSPSHRKQHLFRIASRHINSPPIHNLSLQMSGISTRASSSSLPPPF